MIPLDDWLPLLLIGSMFTFLGVAKSYGLAGCRRRLQQAVWRKTLRHLP